MSKTWKITKTFKLIVAIIMVVTLILSGCARENATDEGAAGGGGDKNKLRIGMVTDTGGVNDNSFNESSWDGLKKFSKETGGKVDYLQSQSDADYVPNLTQFVQDGRDLIWGIGFMMGDSIKTVADQNPDSKFGIIDAVVDSKNVESVTFKENEGAYLVGVVAGLMTKTNKIGFVGGAQIPVIKRFEVGFKAGVKAVNPNAKVTINYTGVFNAPDQGKAAAATIYNNGADIIFHAAGSTGDGVFNEAKERKKAGNKVWVIGVDKDQAITFGNDITLTSMIKRVGTAVYTVCQDVANNKFQGGQIKNLGLKEDGVGLPDKNPNVPEDVLKKVNDYKDKIVNGDITVPEK